MVESVAYDNNDDHEECAHAMGAHAQTRTASGTSMMASNGARMRSTSVGLDIVRCAPHRDFHVHHHIADYELSEESSVPSATPTRIPTAWTSSLCGSSEAIKAPIGVRWAGADLSGSMPDHLL